MFYQYNPYNIHWGPMHWGHAVSKDMLHWEFLPAALAPDEVFDRDGCFSGSAKTLPDGRQLLLYTGVTREPQQTAVCEIYRLSVLLVGDGVDYVKLTLTLFLTETTFRKEQQSGLQRPENLATERRNFYCVLPTALLTAADRFSFTPVRTDLTGSSSPFLHRTATASVKCGNALISWSLATNTYSL